MHVEEVWFGSVLSRVTLLFKKYRHAVFGAGIMGVYGRIQREGDFVHLVAHRLTDLSAELASAGDRDAVFPLPHGRGDGFIMGRRCRIRVDCRRGRGCGISRIPICILMRSG